MTTRVAANIANARLRNNTKVGDQKMAGVKGKITHVGQRSTLGEIGNNPTFQQTDVQKKVPSKKETSQPARGLRKNKGVTSLKAVAEEKSVTTKDVVPQMTSDLSSMDVSDVTPCDVLPVCVQDIDASDKQQPQLVSEYVNDIYTYMLKLEAKFPVCPNYLKDQEINGKMRAILIDWLCQVHNRFNLLQETLYLTVAIIDRFLQHNPVGKSKLQLVSVAAMLIASKYEEMYAPEVNDFVYITDSAYSKKQILQMEQIILKKLNFSLGRPICLQFLRRNSKAGQADAKTHTLAKYLMELTLTEYDMVHYKPSQIAAAAFCLSMNLLYNGEWNETLQHYSTYSESDLIPTVQKLASLAVKAETNKLTAVRTKYSSSKLMKISTLPVLRSQTMIDLAATCS